MFELLCLLMVSRYLVRFAVRAAVICSASSGNIVCGGNEFPKRQFFVTEK